MLSPTLSQRIRDWADDASVYSGVTLCENHSPSKRKSFHMEDVDETPRAKLIRLDSYTPTRSRALEVTNTILEYTLPDSPRSSHASTTTTDDSLLHGSPNKRRRELDDLSTKPVLQAVAEDQLGTWKSQNVTRFPLLKQLLTTLAPKPADRPNDVQSYKTDDTLDMIFTDLKGVPRGANEDYWCELIVFPSCRLAKKWSKQKDVQVIPVKSIGISDPSLLLPQKLQRVRKQSKKRVDYTIGVDAAPYDKIGDLISNAEGRFLGQSNHPQLFDKVLYSHIEVKAVPDPNEGVTQLKIWTCAGFEKQKRLWNLKKGLDATAASPEFRPAPQPLWLWEGNQVQLLIAVMDSQNETIYFLEENSFWLNKKDKHSLVSLIETMKRVMIWGATDYVNWYRENLLGKESSNPVRYQERAENTQEPAETGEDHSNSSTSKDTYIEASVTMGSN